MLYLNILAVLRKSNLEQLKRKNNKLRILSLKVLKNQHSYHVPVINLSSQVLETKPLKYGLHLSFTDKKKFVKRNVAVELESLAASLDHHVEQSNKEAFHEYLRSCTNIITKNIYTDKDDTFTSLQKLRKNKDIIILSVGKESCTVMLNKSDYVRKVDQMIEDCITEGNYIETSDFKIFFIIIFINTKIMKQCDHVLISLAAFSLQLKLISLNPLKTFL